MKKLYYHCEFKAGYMDKYFGVKYQVRDEDGELSDKTIWDYDCFRECSPENPFYIHPDSLHLLEPQVGDLIAYEYEGRIKCYSLIAHPDNGKTKLPERQKIIQRNGIAFMMPEIAA